MTIEEIFSALMEAGDDNRGMEWVKSAGRLYAVYQIFDDRDVPLNTFIWELPSSAIWRDEEEDPEIRLPDGSSYPVRRSARAVDAISLYIDQDIDSRIANNVMRMYENPSGVDVLETIRKALVIDNKITEVFIPSLGYHVDLDGNPVADIEPDWYKKAKEANRYLPDWWSPGMLDLNLKEAMNPEFLAALNVNLDVPGAYELEGDILVGTLLSPTPGELIPRTIMVQDPSFLTLGKTFAAMKENIGYFITLDPDVDLGVNRFFTVGEGEDFVKLATEYAEEHDINERYYLLPTTVNGETYWDMHSEEIPDVDLSVAPSDAFTDRYLDDGRLISGRIAANLAALGEKNRTGIPHSTFQVGGPGQDAAGRPIKTYTFEPDYEVVPGEYHGANAKDDVEEYIANSRRKDLIAVPLPDRAGNQIWTYEIVSDGSQTLTEEQRTALEVSGATITPSATYTDRFVVDETTQLWPNDKQGRERASTYLRDMGLGDSHKVTAGVDGNLYLEPLDDYVGTLYGTQEAADRDVPEGWRTVGHWNADGTQSFGWERIPDEEEEGPANFEELVFSVALTQGGAAALTVDAFRDQVNAAQMSFGQAAQLAVQYGKNATQMKNIMKVLLAPPEAFDSTDFDKVMANAGNALAGTPGYSISDVANQFETGQDIPTLLEGVGPGGGAGIGLPGRQTEILTEASAFEEPGVIYDDEGNPIGLPPDIPGLGLPTTTGIAGHFGADVPITQEMINAAEAGGNAWWQVKERDLAWLAEQTDTQTGAMIVTPDGTEYENVGGAGEPLKWKKVIAEPVISGATSTKPLTTSAAATETEAGGISKADAFIEALTAGEKHEGKDRIGKYTVGTGGRG